MSNIIVERKKKLTSYLNNSETTKRLNDLFLDNKKASKFKATLFNVALDSSLNNCNIESILKSALAIAEAQLPISKQLGLAYILPYGKEAQPSISYKGYKHLLRRDNILIKAREIYKCDDFQQVFDSFDDKFYLQVGARQDNEKWIKDNLIGIWIAVKYIDLDEVENFFVSREKLDQLANLSKSKNSKYSPYNTGFWLEMYLAKAVGYIARKIGVSGEAIGKVFEIENNQSELLQEDKHNNSNDEDIFDIEVETIPTDEVNNDDKQ
jgi:recombination protein RecT